jgi:hypothetical protein
LLECLNRVRAVGLSEVGLVDQGRRLERLAGPEPGGQRRGLAALRVELRQQLGGRPIPPGARVLFQVGQATPPRRRARGGEKKKSRP